MASKDAKDIDRWNPEPRWLGWLVVIALAGIYTALPAHLIVGPRWAYLATIVVLLIPNIVSHYKKYDRLNRILGFLENGVVTLGLIASVGLLISGLPTHREKPTELLFGAASLWVTNILVFTLWYWRLDAGGPHGRDTRKKHDEGAFLFPQMTLPPESGNKAAWSPNFVDYLFLAFNTSTAFSPTDSPVLTRWAKLLTMTQSLISLMVLALLAARAVNIL